MMTNERNRRRASRYVQSAAAAAAIGFAASPAAALTCTQLASNFHRPNTTITTAEIVPAGTFVTPTTSTPNNYGLAAILSGRRVYDADQRLAHQF